MKVRKKLLNSLLIHVFTVKVTSHPGMAYTFCCIKVCKHNPLVSTNYLLDTGTNDWCATRSNGHERMHVNKRGCRLARAGVGELEREQVLAGKAGTSEEAQVRGEGEWLGVIENKR
jgi:hypothetical protein